MNKQCLYNERAKKIVLAVAFGIVGFTINMVSFDIYRANGINVTILLGLIFPLFITIIWGWKYGLISALAGGCQAMWFLWQADGYGMLYSVPIFTLWIVWHGLLSDYRRKTNNSKWFSSPYIAEFIFRVFSELGFITIFRWLLAKNPPFWHSSFTATTVSNDWLMVVIVKHIFFSLFYLLLINIIISNKKVRKIFNIHPPFIGGDSIIVGSALFAIFLIILETIGCTYISQNNHATFMENLFNSNEKQLFTRTIMFVVSIIAGVIISIFYNKILIQKNKTKEILKLSERIGVAERNRLSRKVFLSDLLTTSLAIVDEAEYGVAVIYENDTAVIVDVSGHNNKLIGFEMKSFIDITKTSEIIKINNGKQFLINNANEAEKRKLNAYMKPSHESIIMILSHSGEKIAAIILEKKTGTFSLESIKLVKTIKNIPVLYFSQLYSYQEKHTLFKGIIYAIVKILSLHNEYTKKHSINVANLATGIAAELGLNENQVDTVYWTGLVHDIGKILIPDNILDKNAPLKTEEWEIVKKHPVWGYETLDDNENLKEIAKYVLYHHERWDGKGYPEGISGDNIPLASRIIAIADTYDAMTNERPYRKAMSKETAVEEIGMNIGKQFDPNIAKTFIDNVDKIIEAAKTRLSVPDQRGEERNGTGREHV